jgi:hypothetical protein
MPSPVHVRAAQRVWRRAALSALPLGLSACATFVHGTAQVIPIVSDPPGGRISIDSVLTGVAPLRVTVSRGAHHAVSVSYDTFPALAIPLTRTVSPWVVANLFLFPVVPEALVDFSTGAAFQLRPESVRTVFPVSGAPTADAPRRWNLARGARIRFETPNGGGVFSEGVVDSATAERAYLRLSGDSLPGGLTVMDLRESRRIAVSTAPNGKANGLSAMHYAGLVLSPAALVPFGALLPMMAMPLGFVVGHVAAEPRWSPLEAFRTDSPLLVNDRVRFTTGDGTAGAIRGRLVDFDSVVLSVELESAVTRVARADIRSLQRADGFNFARGAIYGVIGGAVLGALGCLSGSLCARSRGGGSEGPILAAAGATIGFFISPAFAPRRWSDVLRR